VLVAMGPPWITVVQDGNCKVSLTHHASLRGAGGAVGTESGAQSGDRASGTPIFKIWLLGKTLIVKMN
jgi:hypothetical protein